MIEFNTKSAPFNNLKAREAIYYATDWAAINKGLFGGDRTLVQSFTTPFDLFYHQKTPGYRTYDLAKAKDLVKQLGGLKFQLMSRRSDADKQLMTALQTQWQKAGMRVTITDFEVAGLIKEINGAKWQGYLTESGAWDPATGNGLGFHFDSDSPYSGVKDAHLDALIHEGVSTGDSAKRDQVYAEIAKYISDHALGAFGFAQQFANVAVAGVHGPGLTTKVPPYQQAPVIWSEVWRSK
jgi:peptide/nickel transport system substrate-binding protein